MDKILFAIVYPVSRLPFGVLYFISDLLYPLVYYIVRYRRKVVRKNLTCSFPEKPMEEILKIERKFYRFFCDYLVENIKSLTISEEEMKKRMVFENMEAVADTLTRKQMIFLYLGHFCNWEYIASVNWWMPEGTSTAQLYSKLHNEAMDRLFYRIRNHYGGENINKKESLRRIIALKKSGARKMIGFVADQGPKRENIHLWVDFLNQDTPVFTGTERIAKKVDAAIYYGAMRRVKRGYYRMELEKFTEDVNQFEEHELTRLFMKHLEEDIRKDPARWLWSHNRWKRQRNQQD